MKNKRLTEEQKKATLDTLMRFGNMTLVAQHLGFKDRLILMREKRLDKKFAKAVDAAMDCYTDSLEAIADERIRDGKDKASAILLMFRLKALRPDRYRELQTIKHEGNIKIISGVPRPPTVKEITPRDPHALLE